MNIMTHTLKLSRTQPTHTNSQGTIEHYVNNKKLSIQRFLEFSLMLTNSTHMVIINPIIIPQCNGQQPQSILYCTGFKIVTQICWLPVALKPFCPTR